MYYLIEIAQGDSKIAGKGIYEYATKDEAIANFHSKLGTAMKSALYTREQVIVMDENNGVHATEVYVREVAEVTE